MKNDELIHMWQEGNDQMFRDELTDRDMITQYLSEKTLKGNRSINYKLIFYLWSPKSHKLAGLTQAESLPGGPAAGIPGPGRTDRAIKAEIPVALDSCFYSADRFQINYLMPF